ncbi:MAG: Ni/Fe hydrogenase subunit alpha [Polyangiaceae bacterium]|nr:Ni/Fe hydrogenase subunit alpha [Polyangiaceae bacterium]
MTRKIVIEPVTRVEGHGKVTIHLDDRGQVAQARMHIVEFRGFERFVQGRPYWEVPVLVQRLCGICPVSHHLCAAKAMDMVVGVDRLTPTAEKMRRLMHYGQIYQSHALHFFHLASPDLLFGFDADVSQRHVLAVAEKFPELAVQGIMMRRFGQEVILHTSGKKVHGTSAIPGGINRNLPIEARDALLKDLDHNIVWARSAVEVAKNYTVEHLEQVKDFGSFESNHMGLVAADGSMDLYDGVLRAVDAQGKRILDGVKPVEYADVLAEEVRPWSYMKFPFIRKLGPERGWYRVGPLARINVCDRIDTTEAEQARQEFMALSSGKPNNITLAYHWARMIEVLHSVEKIRELLHDPDLQGNDLVATGQRRGEGIAILEAPRGTLFHHYRVNERDEVTMANLIVSTTSNNEPMNQAVRRVAEQHLAGQKEITDGLLNHVEVAIRAYDPCLSCATHALGQMPLELVLFDHNGAQIDRRRKGMRETAG